ncbi:MAG: glycosyltransferase [Clostridiales bacterium]|nr:glycosyltransferase [Clostridiales bacterium]
MKVSVIMPVYNVESYICEALESVIHQTLTDIEIICVDDGSSDKSVDIIQEYMKQDGRIRLLQQDHKNAGAARNLGIEYASGEYLYFFDSDDKCELNLLEETVSIAEETMADIVAFNFFKFYEDGTETRANFGIRTYLLPKDITVFNYKDCPERILSVINPTPWNKIFRSEFVREHSLKFEEIASTNDITFCAVCSACAERIAYSVKALLHYRVGHANTITSDKHNKLPNVIKAVSSVISQVRGLPYYSEIEKSVQYFAIDNYIFALKHNVKDFNAPLCRRYYEFVHQFFNSGLCVNITAEDIKNQDMYESYCIIKRHKYETMQALKSRKLIVSFTSYPARIKWVPEMLKSIFSQTFPADEIVLWLAESQFPEKLADLPENLRRLEEDKQIQIKWCDDLKPHKKYFYAMQEYPDDLIVTIDDDIVYSDQVLEKLYHSYLMYPDAVSTMRTHLIIVDEQKQLLSYNTWIKETDGCRLQPSMQLLATGGSGTLYPPHLLNPALFDKQAMMNTCLLADDLWLKAMEVINDVPVVLASEYAQLQYIPGSQEEALCHTNTSSLNNQNDVQLANVIKWLDQNFEENIFVNKIAESQKGIRIIGIAALCQHLVSERNDLRRRLRLSERNAFRLNERLQISYQQKSEINQKLQIAYQEKSEINRKLQITYKEKAERGIRIKELEAQLKNRSAKKMSPDEASKWNKLIGRIKSLLQ